MGKIGPKFSNLLTVRAEGLTPPLTVSLTVKIPGFFDDHPNLKLTKRFFINRFTIGHIKLYILQSLKSCEHQDGSISQIQ